MLQVVAQAGGMLCRAQCAAWGHRHTFHPAGGEAAAPPAVRSWLLHLQGALAPLWPPPQPPTSPPSPPHSSTSQHIVCAGGGGWGQSIPKFSPFTPLAPEETLDLRLPFAERDKEVVALLLLLLFPPPPHPPAPSIGACTAPPTACDAASCTAADTPAAASAAWPP